MRRFKVVFFVVGTSFLLLHACSKEEQDPVSEQIDADQELRELIIAASDGKGLRSFILPDSDDLSAIPADPNNPLTPEKVNLGKLLYHDAAAAIQAKVEDGMFTYSCASCHHAAGGFAANIAQGIGEGGSGFGVNGEGRIVDPSYPMDSIDVQPIRSPTTLNCAYQPNQLWNGQFGATAENIGTEPQWTPGTPKETNGMGYEGVETQALAGMGVHRLDCDEDLVLGSEYEAYFDEAYPGVPKLHRYTKVTAALAIAAYERTLLANEAPFQLWLKGNESALTAQQKKGAELFFGKANCASCHNGPALNSMEFHALAMGDLDANVIVGGVDYGTRLGRGGFTSDPADDFKFKVPQLYSLKYSLFYGHGSTFNSVREVVEYKNYGVPQNDLVPSSQISTEFVPLGLTEEEIDQLTDFIENGLDDANLSRYEPLELPSGHCFPNNDSQSRIDLGCE